MHAGRGARERRGLGAFVARRPSAVPAAAPRDRRAVVACEPTIAAIPRADPAVEINVVDPFVRKGYRFSGDATVLEAGPLFDAIVAFYRGHGSESAIRHAMLVRVERAQPLVSPAYDRGVNEAEVVARWQARHEERRRRRGDA